MNFGPKKTEVLVIEPEGVESICCIRNLAGQSVKQVNEYKYLGSFISSVEAEVGHRIGLAWAALRKVKDLFSTNLSIKNRFVVLHTLVLPVFLYGSETWTVNAKLLRKIKSTYNDFVRFIKGIKVFSQETQVSIKELLAGGGLDIEMLLLKKRLAFVGHCARADNQYVTDVLTVEPENKKAGGQPHSYTMMLRRDTGLSANQLTAALDLANFTTEGEPDKEKHRVNWRRIMEQATQKLVDLRIKQSKTKKILAIGVGRGRPRYPDHLVKPETLLKRKIYSKKRLAKLVCRNEGCRLWRCNIHCQFCRMEFSEHEGPDERKMCGMCCRGAAVICTQMEDRDNNISSGSEWWCRDCHKLQIDFVNA